LHHSKSYQALDIHNDDYKQTDSNDDQQLNAPNYLINRMPRYQRKYYEPNKLEDDELSPSKEVLKYEPSPLETKKEIINIESELTTNEEKQINSGHPLINDSKQWVYNNDESWYDPRIRTESMESEFEMKNNSHRTSRESDLSKEYKRDKSLTKSHDYDQQKPQLNYSQRSHELSRSISGRISTFDTKRQEVLKRKEFIEKQRIEKIERKIKEKEEKFK